MWLVLPLWKTLLKVSIDYLMRHIEDCCKLNAFFDYSDMLFERKFNKSMSNLKNSQNLKAALSQADPLRLSYLRYLKEFWQSFPYLNFILLKKHVLNSFFLHFCQWLWSWLVHQILNPQRWNPSSFLFNCKAIWQFLYFEVGFFARLFIW